MNWDPSTFFPAFQAAGMTVPAVRMMDGVETQVGFWQPDETTLLDSTVTRQYSAEFEVRAWPALAIGESIKVSGVEYKVRDFPDRTYTGFFAKVLLTKVPPTDDALYPYTTSTSTPPSPPAPQDMNQLTRTASAVVNGHTVVRATSATTCAMADAGTASHGDDILGVAINAASVNGVVTIVHEGPITEPSWSWTPLEPIYAGPGGALTQTPPSLPASTFNVVVGFAQSATTIFVQLEPSIYLG